MTFFRSIRVRLTLWYVLLVAAILAAFSAVLYLSLRQVLYEDLNDSLDNRADVVRALLTYENGRPGLSGVDFQGDPVEGEHFARVLDSSGEVTFDNSDQRFPAPIGEDAVASALGGTSSRRSVETGGDRLRILTAPILRDSEVVGVVQVGLTEEDAREALRILLLIMAIAYPLTLAATSAGGVFLAGRALSPIDKLTRVARRITAEDLSQRLDLALPDDEVGRLARTFDEMIARLDESFARQRQFTADASHELRTPLTAIKGQAEVAMQRDRSPADYKEVLAAINGEVDRMIRLVTSLLTLARAEAGQIPVAREPVSLAAVVGAAVEQVAPGAAEKTISLRAGGAQDVQLVADQDLLLQLMLNLLDNAVKYTPSGGSVEVGWSAAGEDAEIRVTDTGPGIPPEDLPRIFDRFYRVDRARSRAEGGAGLGLSISRWIAEAHGGSIAAQSNSSGATFIVRIPLGR